jgi:hypothetical protein
MTRRLKFFTVVFSVLAGASFVAMPCTIDVSGITMKFAPQVALAKDGSNGNGGGHGGGNGNGGGGGKGNQSSSEGKSSEGKSDGDSKGGKTKGAALQGTASVLGVRHSDGLSEEIRKGRYIMKDARGRTIVNRRATSADQVRLQSLTP